MPFPRGARVRGIWTASACTRHHRSRGWSGRGSRGLEEFAPVSSGVGERRTGHHHRQVTTRCGSGALWPTRTSRSWWVVNGSVMACLRHHGGWYRGGSGGSLGMERELREAVESAYQTQRVDVRDGGYGGGDAEGLRAGRVVISMQRPPRCSRCRTGTLPTTMSRASRQPGARTPSSTCTWLEADVFGEQHSP